ncbi:MAG: SHOCT domain-containing protein [Clostridia bacterium]|nr:SHOCT domain-containing protein [Clostridia bacterium]
MNKTKFILIILSIIFAFADIAWSIYNVVTYFMLDPVLRSPLFYAIYDILVIAVEIAVVVLLIMSIWGNGKMFRQRYGLYMTALVISVITNLTSISTILLVVTMFISDWTWIKNADESKYHKEDVVVVPSKQELIAQLREKKERGEITEEQFQEEIMKLL